ncbi:MAG: competence/damage-inducible protein A [Oscillospiraceae bacterium]|nr:competence/damage-inducible protein A [Oscillospiraceae bacterium]
MIAEIVSVGTELLLGQIVNTDAAYMARRLSDIGVTLYRQVTVGDNPSRLRQALREALERADAVITTGGLGPTADDLTKETAAEAIGLPMERRADAERTLRARFESMQRHMADNNLRQADFARGSILLPNPNGTAQGCVVPFGDKVIIHLPGPPREFIPMTDEHVIPFLAARSGSVIRSRYLRLFGIGESDAESRLSDLMDGTNPTLAPYCSLGEVQLRLTARATDASAADALLDPLEEKTRERVGEFIYARTDDPKDDMAAVVVRRLAAAGRRIAVAESCTGGLLASMIVGQPGASAVFDEACVTYSNEAKTRRLGVSSKLIDEEGAVSEPVARAMAAGLRKLTGVDIAVSTTGIAGPEGGSADKPVGLVWIALADAAGVTARKLSLRGNRNDIRHLACLNALDLIMKSI